MPKHNMVSHGETHTKRKWDRENPFQKLLNNCRYRAKKKGLDFDLDLKYLKSIDKDVCPYLNVPIAFNLPKIRVGQANPNAKSIDRIDSSKGYVKGNVIICSWKANRLLSDATAQELLVLASNFFRVLDNTNHSHNETN